jgi:8-oxo-dGTP pyrophosphatase MutT (NUDIX family)
MFPSLRQIERGLDGAPQPLTADADAAVMVCLREDDGEVQVLLVRRAVRDGDPWSGHVGLPGGRPSPVDRDPLDTARRETIEEVGFDPLVAGRLLGALPILNTRMLRIRVAAYVAHVPEAVETLLSDELTAAWWTSLQRLRPDTVLVPELPDPVEALLDDAGVPEPHVVWGITYRLLGLLRDAGGPPAPTVQTPEP